MSDSKTTMIEHTGPAPTDNSEAAWPMGNAPTPEQAARDMLERMGVDDAQSWSAGDVVELAELIDEVLELRRQVRLLDGER